MIKCISATLLILSLLTPGCSKSSSKFDISAHGDTVSIRYLDYELDVNDTTSSGLNVHVIVTGRTIPVGLRGDTARAEIIVNIDKKICTYEEQSYDISDSEVITISDTGITI